MKWWGLILYVIDVNVAVGDGIDGQGGDAFETEFIHDILAMGDDGG